MKTEDGFEGTREEMERAIRRPNVLEYVILAAAVLLALAGGGVAAYVLGAGTNLPFRLLWALMSLALLLIPGALVFGRDYLSRRREADRSSRGQRRDNG